MRLLDIKLFNFPLIVPLSIPSLAQSIAGITRTLFYDIHQDRHAENECLFLVGFIRIIKFYIPTGGPSVAAIWRDPSPHLTTLSN